MLAIDAGRGERNLPSAAGGTAMRAIREGIKVVFLTMHQNAAYARRALEAGAAGFVVKHSAPEELVIAIRAALKGKTFITPALTEDVLESMQHGSKGGNDPSASLTPRQTLYRFSPEGRDTASVQ